VGTAGAHGFFCLPDVLVAPSIIHNILSIRRFTANNSCSVEFDSSGLTVKDLAFRRPLLRCDSTGPLYTLRFPAATLSSSTPVLSAAFATSTSSTTWHQRLGHPGCDALMQLSRNSGLPCTRLMMSICVMRANWAVMFVFLFDLVHCDLWTSPVISISGYKYYLVVVDDFSHYSWTFTLRAKSDTFPTLLHLGVHTVQPHHQGRPV
jgi:hypothetical protein